ncbi:MAG: alpha-amylase family glycosyl hydrolase [Chthoniobacteraceae bacterium]
MPNVDSFFHDGSTLSVRLPATLLSDGHTAIFLALGMGASGGSARMPHGRQDEGSTLYLPFQASRLYGIHFQGESINRIERRDYLQNHWTERTAVPSEVTTRLTNRVISISTSVPDPNYPLKLGVWAKDMDRNDGWGCLIADDALGIRPAGNDQYLERQLTFDSPTTPARIAFRHNRSQSPRVRIYQLLPRLFGNTNETRMRNGPLAVNGVGKFGDLNEAALTGIKELACTHIWLTGIHAQASATSFPELGMTGDDPDLLKGLAGSPYAIRDYFDVCPDYAIDPARRLEEFKALVDRIHGHGMKVIIDLVANHVARCYHSLIKPDLTFGRSDDQTVFFSPTNNFYWLQPDSPGDGPPLRLPTVDDDGHLVSSTCRVLGSGDGLYAGEMTAGRVTGNNVAHWRPSLNDWYETVKLNYGYDFTTGRHSYPRFDDRNAAIPDTWIKMDAVLAYWQDFGVDGFRCDMAHMVPPEFWHWSLERARHRQPTVYFAAEAYDNDPMKVCDGNIMTALLEAGFDAVYDDPSYKALKNLYDGSGWANDLDGALGVVDREFVFQNSLRYAENHDEVRLAGKGQWGSAGLKIGCAISAILYGLSRGPVLFCSGQEIGEPAEGAEGFAPDNARTSIFDYWSMPEFAKWVNGHRYDGGRLSSEQKALRSSYARLLAMMDEPAFRDGEFYGLNSANRDNERFGRLPGEPASGHWFYAFLRYDAASGQRLLVIANLHPTETLERVRVQIPEDAIVFIGLRAPTRVSITDRLNNRPASGIFAMGDGIELGDLDPATPCFFEFQIIES